MHVPSALQDYLAQISRFPLLGKEEEIELARKIQAAIALRKNLISSPHYPTEKLELKDSSDRISSLTCYQKQAIQTKLLKIGDRAKQKMIESNLRLVVSIAKKYQPKTLDIMDLIQEGNLGLNRAVDKYDPLRGYRFTTYAYWWIRQAVTRAIFSQGRAIHLPMHITEKINKIKKTQRELTQQNQRVATYEEVAERLEIPFEKVQEYIGFSTVPISLDLLVGQDDDCSLQELIDDEDTSTSPENYVQNEQLRDLVRELFSHLPKHQQDILALRFGLHDGRERTLRETAIAFNVSREWIRQIDTKAKRSLHQKYHKSKLINSYLMVE